MERQSSHKAPTQIAILGLVGLVAALLYGCATPTTVQISTLSPTTPTAGAMPTGTAVGAAATATSTTAMPTASAVATVAATPTPIAATGLQLASLGCVCHLQSQQGAPPVAQVAALPAATIQQTVRQGRGTMPAWSAQNLSDAWLTAIIAALKSSQQVTPAATP